MSGSYDIIIVGAGHNGLVTAAYLARAGKRVLVLERRHVVGGACVTEELWPDFKVSTAAYVNSLLRPEIIRDLELPRHGFELLPRSPSSFTPFPDGRFLLMGPDKELTRQQVAKFSERDAEALPRYEAMLERVADFIEPTLLQTPPNPWSFRPGNLAQLAGLGWRFLKLGREGPAALEILTGAARPILDRWFESEQLKIALATDAIIGAMAGMWGYVRGGMGGISQALASAARSRGVEIRVNSPVARIVTRRGRVKGVALEDGTEFQAKKVVSNADAHVTFLSLVDQQELEPEFVAAVKNIDYASASLKINVALSELPDFTAVRGSGLPLNGHLRGTIHVAPTLDYIERAYDDAKYGRPSADPILECTIPSVVDTTVAPPGKRALPAAQRVVGPAEGSVRGSLLRHPQRVRTKLQALRDRPAGALAARPGAPVRPHGWQHLPGRHDPVTALFPAPAARIRRLSHSRQRVVHVRLGDAPGRRGHGGVRIQRCTRDPAGPLVHPLLGGGR